MYDKETRNKNFSKKILDIIITVIVVILADVISEKCFHGTLSSHVLIMVAFFVLLIPVNLLIVKKNDK